MADAERAAISGQPADTESLYPRMRDRVGPHRLWKLPEGVDALTVMDRDPPQFFMSQEPDFPNDILADAIYYHLAQGVTIDAIHKFPGLPNEREVRHLLFTSQAYFNPSNRPTIQIQYACRESHQAALTSYSKTFSTKVSVPETCLNFERDTLFLQGSKFALQFGSRNMAMWLPEGVSYINDSENLAQVQNIAVLLDDYEMAENPSCLSEWLASLFCYFVGIKGVALVFCCIEQDTVSEGFRPYTPGKKDTPCFFIDPEVIEAVCRVNGLFDEKEIEDLEELMKEFRQTERRVTNWHRPDISKLESLRLASSEDRKAGWSLPKFENKVAISPTNYNCEDDLAALKDLWARLKIEVFDDYKTLKLFMQFQRANRK